MGIGSAVTSGFGNNPDRASLVNPLFRSEGEAVQPGLFFNPVEFDGIKRGCGAAALISGNKFPVVIHTLPICITYNYP